MRDSLLRVVLCLSLCGLFATPVVADEESNLYSAEQYKSWIEVLASDEYEGRGTGQEGIDKAADYIADVWSSFGVEPGGDDNTFFQNFELALSREIGGSTRLAIGTKGRKIRVPASLDEEFVPLPWSEQGEFEGGVVFAGYGIDSDEENYNDYSDLDVDGKAVMVLRRSPDFGNFTMGDQAFRSKARRARERGAVALIIVNKGGDSGLYEFDRGGRAGGSYGIPMLQVTPETATRMLEAGGLPDIETIEKKINETEKPFAGELEGVSVRGSVDIRPVYSPVKNVIGVIPGTGPQKDEYIVLGGHYDHLGIRNKGEPNFDPEKDISNGADDNASGIAMLMNLAKIFTQSDNRPNRTMILMAFTGEELGLLGSDYYADHPTIDLDKAAVMLNFDMVGRLKDDNLEVGGMRTGGFEDLVHETAEKYGLEISDGGGGRGPSDHTNFYRKDVPVMFFFTGLHGQYHRPEDDTPLINADGSMKIARLVTDLIENIDGRSDMPEFAKDTRQARISRQSDRRSPREERRTAQREERREEQRAEQRPQAPERPRVTLGVRLLADDSDGVKIDSVIEDSAAERAGLKQGDRILSINGEAIKQPMDILGALRGVSPDGNLKLGIKRDGKDQDVVVWFGKKPTSKVKRYLSVNTAMRNDMNGVLNDESLIKDIISSSLTTRRDGAEFSVRTSGDISSEFITKAMQQMRSTWEKNVPPASDEVVVVTTDVVLMKENNESWETTLTVKLAVEKVRGGQSVAQQATAQASPHREHGRSPGDDEAEADDSENRERPGVSLQIMPTYGEGDGEGYEISGVIEGGAAANAGMRDKDRIYSIGGRKVTNIYEYMDSLRKFKPGDEIEVVVLRGGEKVTLKVKGAGYGGGAPS